MHAKSSDLARIQEIYSTITQTKRQIAEIGFTQERFVNPPTSEDDLVAEGIMNRVFRVAEEAGKLSEDIAAKYDLDQRGMSGVRNRLAHAYGDVDKEIIWTVLEKEFDILLAACRGYCDERGIDLA